MYIASQMVPQPRVTGYRIVYQSPLGQRRHQLVQITEAEKQVDLWNLFLQRRSIPLDQTAYRNHGFHVRTPLEAAGLDHCLDRFLFGGVDEATGIHQHHIGIFNLVNDCSTVTNQVTDQTLRVNGGLVAAEGDDAEFQLRPLHRAQCEIWSNSIP